jgi:class 3 adenylate cyclase
VDTPETKYARTLDGVHIAYQVRGDGPIDLIYVAGWATNFEVDLEEPRMARFVNGLTRFARVVLFDKRGTGLSDRSHTPDLEKRADDIRAVLDAIGSGSAVLFGESEGGALSAFFAATHPDRVTGLIAYGSHARYSRSSDYDLGVSDEDLQAFHDHVGEAWGSIEFAKRWLEDEAPSLAGNQEFVHQFARSLRHAATPASAVEFNALRLGIDVRSVLGSVQAPTLVLERRGVWDVELTPAQDFTSRIPGAKYRELAGKDYILIAGDVDELLTASEQFVQSIQAEQTEIGRSLATVLFTDIVGSTERAVELGDRGWRTLVERHHEIVRTLLGRYRGVEMDTAGDGFFATFDGPARAIRCALAIRDAVIPLGIEVRSGLHTGEVEMIDRKVGGIAVTIGSRICGLAEPSEVLASQTVRDLVAGSGLAFEHVGEHELKGVPDRWRLYKVVG